MRVEVAVAASAGARVNDGGAHLACEHIHQEVSADMGKRGVPEPGIPKW